MNYSPNLSSEVEVVANTNILPSNQVAVIGCGYVGKAIARYWHDKGYSVTGTTTRAENLADLEAITNQAIVMTTEDVSAVEKLISEQDTIVVSVAPISDRQVDAQTYAQTYLPTTKNLVQALKNNSTVRQVIYISSGSVYGDTQGEWVDESSPLDLDNEYTQVLAEAEATLLALNEAEEQDIKVCILRLGGIYGPGRELNKRIGRLAGKTIPGDGSSYVAWIHLDDIVAGVDFVRQHRCQGIYNLVNDFKLTSKELCDLICDRQNLERVTWDQSKSPFSSLNARVDNSKLKKAGYKLIYPDTIV